MDPLWNSHIVAGVNKESGERYGERERGREELALMTHHGSYT